MMSLTKKLASVPVAGFAAAGPLSATTASAEGERYVLVSHAPDSDAGENTIKNGIALEVSRWGVEVD